MTRILLIGSQGQLGQELQMTLPALGDVVAVGRSQLDLTDLPQLRSLIAETAPHIVVNAAAYTAVDKAESEVDLAKAINAIAPTVMAEEVQKTGACLVHFSTDYVFDGRKNTPYLEDDSPNPCGAYAESKLLGEDGIRQTCDRHFIIRTAWVYGSRGKGNFVKTMLRLGGEREELRVVTDQVGSPTWTKDIADATTQLLTHWSQKQAPAYGVYHFTNSGVASWYDFAIAIFEEARQLHQMLKVERVLPITTAEYPTPARRPAYSVLSGKKIAAVIGQPAPHWRQSLRTMLNEFVQAD
ncbi:MAG: dTDP-4-dehydrorhamnose reductase [Synechococcales bacterium]|nr:dTDP-4-dehydrorhamnose reductase [Synechococcales bacterium]